jgi:F-type H+-transporting ATPase subunit gamma
MGYLIPQTGDVESPYTKAHADGVTGYLVITADRGLCGGYNGNVIRMCVEHMRSTGDDVALVVVGRKGRDYFVRHGYDVKAQFLSVPDKPEYRMARDIATSLLEPFNAGVFKRVYMVSTKFVSVLDRKPFVSQLLPFDIEEIRSQLEVEELEELYIYEPSAGTVLNSLFPKFLEMQIYAALIEAKVSEFAARMTAMDSATDNADEMIEKLTLQLNRARQAQITQELSEIVGGAEALK